MTRHEAIASLVINTGISILFGMWLGGLATLISFIVLYIISGAFNYCDAEIWTWILVIFKK